MNNQDRILILIVCSDLGNLKNLDFLFHQAQHQLKLVSSIDEGLCVLRQERVGCIILYTDDLDLKKETVRELKQEEQGVNIPLIIIISDTSHEAIIKMLKTGADDCLNRFSDHEIIHSRIKTVLHISKLKNQLLRSEQKIREISLAIQELSIKDNLTGIYNRKFFKEIMEKEVAQAKRYNQNLCCAIIDIDDLRIINESYGQDFGNHIIKKVANLIKNSFRQSDIIFRYTVDDLIDNPCLYGGDEFIVLLTNTDYEGAMVAINNFCQLLKKNPIPVNGLNLEIRAHIGISSLFDDTIFGNKEMFISRAEDALLETKRLKEPCVLQYRGCGSKHLIDESHLLRLKEKIFSIENQSKEIYLASIKTLIAALETRDLYTKEHSINVSRYAKLIATALQLPPQEIRYIETAALLHDIGKIGISDTILNKRGTLTIEEYEIIKNHPLLGIQILKRSGYLTRELSIILYHHERYDGCGYPEGLSGRHIPLGSRIIAVADTYDAMSNPRAYRSAFSARAVLEELVNIAGTQLDAEIIQIFFQTLANNSAMPDEKIDWPYYLSKL